PYLHRQEHAADDGFRGRRATLPLGRFDRPRRLWHARRHLSAAANGKIVVLESVLQLAHAIFDLFPWRICDPRQLRDQPPRWSGLAWLRAAAPRKPGEFF